MSYSTKKYSIKRAVKPIGKALQLFMLLSMVLYSNILYEEITLDKYSYEDEILIAQGEEFLIRNNYMSLSFDEDEIKNILKSNQPVVIRVIGINLFNNLTRRRVIDGRSKDE